jgi:hypothetical protein
LRLENPGQELPKEADRLLQAIPKAELLVAYRNYLQNWEPSSDFDSYLIQESDEGNNLFSKDRIDDNVEREFDESNVSAFEDETQVTATVDDLGPQTSPETNLTRQIYPEALITPPTTSPSTISSRSDAPSTPQTTEQPQFHCPFSKCSRISTLKEALDKHISAKHNKRFRCDVPGCTKGPFGYREDIARHKRRAHRDLVSSPPLKVVMRCPYRGCKSKTKDGRTDNFWRHLRVKHGLDKEEAKKIEPLREDVS